MAKIILFNPCPVSKKRVFFNKPHPKKANPLLPFFQFLQLRFKVYTVWRLQFFWLSLKTAIQKRHFWLMKTIINKKGFINSCFSASHKARYTTDAPVRKGIVAMSSVRREGTPAKQTKQRVAYAGKVIAFNG